jgi:Xaa-Pro aminopeptidase
MKYHSIPKDLFIENRGKFIKELKPQSLAVFFSNDLVPVNADAHYPFSQNSNFFWLTGIDQEECILWLFPDCPREEFREILFIRKTNEQIQTWEGWKYSKEEALETSGIKNIKYVEEFEAVFLQAIGFCENIYLDFNEHPRNTLFYATPAHHLAYRIQKEFPAHKIQRAYPILAYLRSIKSEIEIQLLRKAIEITHQAFLRVLKFIRPGVYEYEIEAEIWHEFIRNRATGPAYGSIIASGKNACVLHYVLNNAVCHDGDMILLDFGAEYANYSADLTRTVPINGKFTPRQKQVYEAVLTVMKESKKLLVPGKDNIYSYHKKVGEIMTDELLEIGLLTTEEVKNQNPDCPAYKKYFMHGTSHYLGLDTHDVGFMHKTFEPGMVFTCEPGIYILEEGLGIRLENNILITENGNVDLMENIPIEIEEIESLMNSGK